MTRLNSKDLNTFILSYVHHADSRSLPHPHHPILLTTATVSFAFQIFITYGLENPSLQHVQGNVLKGQSLRKESTSLKFRHYKTLWEINYPYIV